jgi:hypothetical protein
MAKKKTVSSAHKQSAFSVSLSIAKIRLGFFMVSSTPVRCDGLGALHAAMGATQVSNEHSNCTAATTRESAVKLASWQ